MCAEIYSRMEIVDTIGEPEDYASFHLQINMLLNYTVKPLQTGILMSNRSYPDVHCISVFDKDYYSTRGSSPAS